MNEFEIRYNEANRKYEAEVERSTRLERELAEAREQLREQIEELVVTQGERDAEKTVNARHREHSNSWFETCKVRTRQWREEQARAEKAEAERDALDVKFEEDGVVYSLLDWQAKLQTELGIARVENVYLRKAIPSLSMLNAAIKLAQTVPANTLGSASKPAYVSEEGHVQGSSWFIVHELLDDLVKLREVVEGLEREG